MTQRDNIARLVAAVGALVGWAALALQFVLLVQKMQADGGTLLQGAWRFFGFFTILANILVAGALTHAALRYEKRVGFGAPRMELAVAAAIAMVGLVYSALLRATWNPQGWQKVADAVLHDVTPVVFLAFFLLRRRRPLRWRAAAVVLVFPIAYVVYAFARGAADGWYAYYFLDPTRLGPAQLAMNVAGLSVAFWIMGLALVGLSNIFASDRRT